MPGASCFATASAGLTAFHCTPGDHDEGRVLMFGSHLGRVEPPSSFRKNFFRRSVDLAVHEHAARVLIRRRSLDTYAEPVGTGIVARAELDRQSETCDGIRDTHTYLNDARNHTRSGSCIANFRNLPIDLHG